MEDLICQIVQYESLKRFAEQLGLHLQADPAAGAFLIKEIGSKADPMYTSLDSVGAFLSGYAEGRR